MYKNIMDLHVHTDNSFDGNHSVMRMCESAQDKGLRAIAFTDHIEADCFREHRYDRVAAQAYFDISKARSAFCGTLLVCQGIELGQAMYNQEVSEELFRKYKYDILVASLHNLRNGHDFSVPDYDEYEDDIIDAMLQEYFDELVILSGWDKLDTLAHMTYPLRYICGKYGKKVDMSRYSEKIDATLKNLADNDKALEINTSGLRQEIGTTMPDESIVRRFKELGGKYITIGSDSHYAEDIGKGIVQGMDIALRCGFDSVTLFQQHEAIPIKIE